MTPCPVCHSTERVPCKGLQHQPLDAQCLGLDAAVLQRSRAGYLPRVIGKLCGCSEERVIFILERKGVTRPVPIKLSLSSATIEEIISLYDDGLSYRKVSAKVHVNANICRDVVKQYAPEIMRSPAQQKGVAWGNNRQPLAEFHLCELGLRRNRYPCYACKIELMIPKSEGNSQSKRLCGLCEAHAVRIKSLAVRQKAYISKAERSSRNEP